MSEISQALAAKALDALALRQTAIAQNIANSNSESFAIQTVEFEAALREAATQGPAAVEALVFQIQDGADQRPGSEIRLDLEMQESAATAMRYSALSDLLGRQMQIARTAIRGGQ